MMTRIIEHDEEEDFELAQYVIEMNLNVELPESKSKAKLEGKYAFPLAEMVIERKTKGSLPLLGEILEISTYDLDKQIIYLNLLLGETKRLTLSLNKSENVKFNFKNKDGDLRKGSLSLELKKFDFDDYKSSDKIVVEEIIAEETAIRKIKESHRKKFAVKFQSDEPQLVGSSFYQVELVNKECDYVIMAASDIGDDSEIINTFIPVSKDEPNISIMSFVGGNRLMYKVVTKAYFKRGLFK